MMTLRIRSLLTSRNCVVCVYFRTLRRDAWANQPAYILISQGRNETK